jgi:hypothetical protein
MIKDGTLLVCLWKDEPLLGVLISSTGRINGGTGDSWAEIFWSDGHTTWEEWEASIDVCFKVIA